MVKNPGTAARPHHLRALNEPRPITVVTREGHPVAILDEHSQQTITQIQDTWIVQDEWWRQEIYRYYYRLLLRNGTLCTIYHDCIANTWHKQAY